MRLVSAGVRVARIASRRRRLWNALRRGFSSVWNAYMVERDDFGSDETAVAHFQIIQALRRTDPARPTAADGKRVERLRDAPRKPGDGNPASALEDPLSGGREAVGTAPPRIIRARDGSGGMLTPNTIPPVNRETSAPLADVPFAGDSKTDIPAINRSATEAARSIIEEWVNFAELRAVDVQSSSACPFNGAPRTGKTRPAPITEAT